MFARPTVFILGAGASAEFGLPPGSKLKTQVADALRFHDGGDPHLRDLIRQRFPTEHEDYFRAGHDFSKTVDSFASIDEALHYSSASSETVLLGKIAIAQAILKAERGSNIFSKARIEQEFATHAEDWWLTHFLRMAASSRTLAEMKIAFEKVTFINFNYDRSVEQFISWMLQAKFNLTESTAQEAIRRLRIIRPYGSLGDHGRHDQGVPFGGSAGDWDNDLFSIAKDIHTYTEQAIDGEVGRKIRNRMDAAELVVFLGFGFHPQNMSILSVDKSALRRVFATVSGIPGLNYDALRDFIGSTLKGQHPPQLHPMLAGRFLSTLRPSIMMAVGS